MRRIHLLIVWLVACALPGPAAMGVDEAPVRVLVLTGANNHDWQSTTPLLTQLFEENPRFRMAGTLDEPSKLTADMLREVDVIVSNWSGFPDMQRGWGATAETAFLEFVRSGKGFVVFHAAAATCQSWPEFQQMVQVTWGLEKTAHGAYHTLKVTIDNADHPITRGLSDFWTTDELWHNTVSLAGIPPQAIVKAWSEPDFGGSGKYEPVLLPTTFGKGRAVNLVLGHDAHAMRNVGWRTLMLRSAEWAATGVVTLKPPREWPVTSAHAVITDVDLDAMLEKLAAYRDGGSREAAAIVNAFTTHAHSLQGNEGNRRCREIASKLAALIRRNTPPEVKDPVCRQLASIATAEQVPLLASMLDEERVAQSACTALMRVPGPSGAEALRTGAQRLRGRSLVAVVNTLGDLRDRESVALLIPLLDESEEEVAASAAGALGKIGGEQAGRALLTELAKSSGPRRAELADAALLCADDLNGKSAATAREIYELLLRPSEAPAARMAALRGLAACTDGAERQRVILAGLADADARLARVARSCVREFLLHGKAISAWLPSAMKAAAHERERQALVRILADEPSVGAMQLALGYLDDPHLAAEAAQAAVSCGSGLVDRNREVVKAAMRQVVAAGPAAGDLSEAEALLREALRVVNLARQAVASSPDGLEPDGASGPDAAGNDGNLETYWDEADNQPLYRYRLTFPGPVQMDSLVIVGHAFESHSPKDFDVLCDGRVVREVTNARYDRVKNTVAVEFDPTTCTTLELQITGYYARSPGIRELEVYDTSHDAAGR